MSEDAVLVKFRKMLMERGVKGIRSITMYFRRIDDNGSRTLDLAEFEQGVKDHNISLSRDEIHHLFALFDRDNSGTIDCNEFVRSVRPQMNKTRLEWVEKAFAKMDKTGDKRITIEDLKGVYSAKQHPKYLNGSCSEDEIFAKFLEKFEAGGNKDGVITLEEFIDYYSGVSAQIDDDVYFSTMMAKCWQL